MNILAIESSCDETAAAVVKDGVEILGGAVATSTNMHEKWGGIVPEVAAREQLTSIIPVITETLRSIDPHISPLTYRKTIVKHIDAIAVTVGPGLIGSLLIGVETAKTLASVSDIPIIPVNHVLAHMYANFLDSSQPPLTLHSGQAALSHQSIHLKAEDRKLITFPAISLVVSGGHTELFLMTSKKDLQWLGGTIDDAAGEAFDKSARLLGFGHGGGRAIENTSRNYELRMTNDTSQIRLPRPMMHDDSYTFSFSGLKTAVLREVNKWKEKDGLDEQMINYLSYEVQESITDVLVKKTIHAALQYHAKSILISGGVAANTRLREKFITKINDEGLTINFSCPPIEFCTDNAAYIGSYAFFRGIPVDWRTITAVPDLSVEVV